MSPLSEVRERTPQFAAIDVNFRAVLESHRAVTHASQLAYSTPDSYSLARQRARNAARAMASEVKHWQKDTDEWRRTHVAK